MKRTDDANYIPQRDGKDVVAVGYKSGRSNNSVVIEISGNEQISIDIFDSRRIRCGTTPERIDTPLDRARGSIQRNHSRYGISILASKSHIDRAVDVSARSHLASDVDGRPVGAAGDPTNVLGSRAPGALVLVPPKELPIFGKFDDGGARRSEVGPVDFATGSLVAAEVSTCVNVVVDIDVDRTGKVDHVAWIPDVGGDRGDPSGIETVIPLDHETVQVASSVHKHRDVVDRKVAVEAASLVSVALRVSSNVGTVEETVGSEADVSVAHGGFLAKTKTQKCVNTRSKPQQIVEGQPKENTAWQKTMMLTEADVVAVFVKVVNVVVALVVVRPAVFVVVLARTVTSSAGTTSEVAPVWRV